MLKPQEFSLDCLGFYEKCQWRKKLTVKQEAKTEGTGPRARRSSAHNSQTEICSIQGKNQSVQNIRH